MAIINENEMRQDTVLHVAKKMVLAARTAPKARGINNIAMSILTGSDIQSLAKTMKEIGEKQDNQIFLRDASNVLNHAQAVVIMGTKIESLGLKTCGLCGFPDCASKNKQPEIPCAFNTGDLGIAMGSAVSVAMDARIDNRIMYTIGFAAQQMGLLGKNYNIVYGIPLSAASKNPFFDRKK
ncbi:MAG: ferredoxin [Bacteroidia bacterium]|nr:MAG: ferredoxin [Bacteroidia bacterium]